MHRCKAASLGASRHRSAGFAKPPQPGYLALPRHIAFLGRRAALDGLIISIGTAPTSPSTNTISAWKADLLPWNWTPAPAKLAA
jgi:hypothetical protein